MPSDALKKLSIENSPKPQVTNNRAPARNLNTPVRNNQPPSTISSTTLSPRTPTTLAEPIPTTKAPSLLGEIQASSDQYSENLEAEAKQLGQNNKGGIQFYIDQLAASRGKTELTDQAYRTAGGVDDVQVELNDINDQIRKEQRSLDLARRNITESGGQSKMQAQAAINNVTRDSLKTQADLSIIQQGVQGRYDSAKAIADRAVSAQLEQQTNDLAIAKFNYEENKELFTKAEQRAFEAKAADRERALNEQKENQTAIYDMAIQAQLDGAPTAVVQSMMSAKTRDEAMAFGGQYIGALDREAKQVGIEAQRQSIEASKASVAANYASIDLAERKFQYQQQQEALGLELKALKDAGVITEEQAANQQKVDQALTLKDLVSKIRGHAGFNLSVGSPGARVFDPTEFGIAGQLYNYLSGQGEGFDALYDQLTENLTLANLDKMSGVLTDRDIQVLRSAATRLRKTTTEKEFLGVLDEMDRTFQRSIDEFGVTPQQARFHYGADDETINEIDSIWGGTGTQTSSLLKKPL